MGNIRERLLGNPKVVVFLYIISILAVWQILGLNAFLVYALTMGLFVLYLTRKIKLTERMQEINVKPEEAEQIASKRMYEKDMPVFSVEAHMPVQIIREVHWRFYLNWLRNNTKKLQMVDVSAVDGSISAFKPVDYMPPEGIWNDNERFKDKDEIQAPRMFKEEYLREQRT